MSKVLATVGVGSDGHTFGLLPQEDAKIFDSLFPQQKTFVAYEHSGKTEHPHRLTLTPSSGCRLHGVYGVALGDAKGWVLDLLRQARLDRPPHAFPARILWSIPGALYTDR
jgi:6-phosphogluconolactonase/glucosamine-6-phosphate isomerase/deaminase